VGSGGLNAGSGGAWILFQGVSCCAEAKDASNSKHKNADTEKQIPRRLKSPRDENSFFMTWTRR
jgi:hypothetical protein